MAVVLLLYIVLMRRVGRRRKQQIKHAEKQLARLHKNKRNERSE